MSSWYPKKGRIIFHIDMNCFYASVEMAHDPKLKGKPVAIAGNPEERRGIIVTSSYEARDKGVRTTMPLWQAKKLCPELIVLRPNFDRYRKASQEIFSMLAKITPFTEPVSIDEGYLDITNCEHLGNPLEIAHKIQQMLLQQLDLPCSIGIGPNKFLAKMASDMKKPLGITVLRKRELPQTLWPLPVEEMYGVGKKTAEKLQLIEVHTIGDLATKDVYDLTHLLGINGERLKNRANGIDPRPVDPDSVNEFKSIGNSKTLPYDTTDDLEIRNLLQDLASTIDRRMNRRDIVGLNVQLMIRYSNRKTITRSKKLPAYISDEEEIFETAYDLFQQHWNLEPIRLLGITVQDLEEKKNVVKQLNLFTYEKEIEKAKLEDVVHQLSNKYGKNTFKQLESKETQNDFRTSFQKDFLDDFKN